MVMYGRTHRGGCPAAQNYRTPRGAAPPEPAATATEHGDARGVDVSGEHMTPLFTAR
jgi:hypothetical protein